jgi:hypothetical protein
VADHLTHTLNESLDALNTAASGDSLCTLSGDKVEAAKYLEGQVIALKLALRFAKAPEGDYNTATDLFREVRSEWIRKNLEGFSSSPSWVSYRTGGLDALASAERFASGK